MKFKREKMKKYYVCENLLEVGIAGLINSNKKVVISEDDYKKLKKGEVVKIYSSDSK